MLELDVRVSPIRSSTGRISAPVGDVAFGEVDGSARLRLEAGVEQRRVDPFRGFHDATLPPATVAPSVTKCAPAVEVVRR